MKYCLFIVNFKMLTWYSILPRSWLLSVSGIFQSQLGSDEASGRAVDVALFLLFLGLLISLGVFFALFSALAPRAAAAEALLMFESPCLEWVPNLCC